MKKIFVIKNGKILASHQLDQLTEIENKYPNCEIVEWDGPDISIEKGKILMDYDDPRTEEQKQADIKKRIIKETLVKHDTEKVNGITLSNGMKLGFTQQEVDNYMRQGVRISMVGSSLQSVSLWDVYDVEYVMTPAEAMVIIAEYAILVGQKIEEQLRELTALNAK